jgi:hypothetical protein
LTSEARRAQVQGLARAELQFLERERGFRPEVVEEPRRDVLAYVGERETFELELDWHEQAAFLLVCLTVDGRRPPGYYVHEGRRVRLQLVEALTLANATDAAGTAAELRAATRRSGVAAMEEQVRLAASALRSSLDKLLDARSALFPTQQTEAGGSR